MRMMTMMTFTPTDLTRRGFLMASVAACAVAATPAMAFSTTEAKQLIDSVVARINQVINSGRSESAMIKDFSKLFADFADLNFIAFKTLGPPARSASKAQMAAYTKAFQGYMSRKYGKRFREFIGGKIIVEQAKALKSYYEVETTTILRGRAPFNGSYFVSDKSGKPKFFDMRIEGVSLVNSEKDEIGSLLDRNGGNIDKLIATLNSLG